MTCAPMLSRPVKSPSKAARQAGPKRGGMGRAVAVRTGWAIAPPDGAGLRGAPLPSGLPVAVGIGGGVGEGQGAGGAGLPVAA